MKKFSFFLLLIPFWIAFWGFYSYPSISLHDLSKQDPIRELLLNGLSGDLDSMEQLCNIWEIEPIISIQTDAPSQLFFPQTYPAAHALLALMPIEATMAFPRGFKQHEKTMLLPENPPELPFCYAEFLWRQKPSCTFISTYSNPSFVATLQAQQLSYQKANPLHTIQDVMTNIRSIGTLTDSPKANALIAFMQIALAAIDQSLDKASEEIQKVFLFHHLHFTSPSPNTLTGELLKRLQFNCIEASLESLYKADPDLLVITSPSQKHLEKELAMLPGFTELKAFQNNQIFYVEASIQHSPTQFLVLAYYDLAQTIIHTLKQKEQTCL